MKLSIPTKFKPNKAAIVLSVAVGVGLLAALVARNYLSNRVEAIEAKAHGKTVDLVVAKVDLPKDAVLSSQNVAIRQIPIEYAHEAAITPNNFNRADGEKLAFPIKAGQLIMWSLLEAKKAPSFSTRVDVGRRAMTVPVDEISSISGLLEPGDVIDLIVTVDIESKKTTFPVLQGVQVLATGQRATDDPKNGERREYTTVTLDTTPEQAQNVIMARESGKITALLRNPQDKQEMADEQIDIASMLSKKRNGSKAVGASASAPAGDEIPVLYGGRSTTFTPEQLTMNHRSKTGAATPTSSQDKTNAAATAARMATDLIKTQTKAMAGSTSPSRDQ